MKYSVALVLLASLLVTGCATKVVVKPIDGSPVEIPNSDEVQSVLLANDDPSHSYLYPSNSTAVAEEVLGWLKSAKPVSVKFPQLHQQWSSGAYVGPATIVLTLNNDQTISIEPAYYVSVTSDGRIIDHYVRDVVLYETNGRQEKYFRDSKLYQWLRSDQWKQELSESMPAHLP